MSKSPGKEVRQSIELRNDSTIILGNEGRPVEDRGTPPPIDIGAGIITNIVTNPTSPDINGNFSVIVTIVGRFSQGVQLQYKYTRPNGGVTSWIPITPQNSTNSSATFQLSSGLEPGGSFLVIKSIQNQIVVDEQTLAFNIIGEEALVP